MATDLEVRAMAAYFRAASKASKGMGNIAQPSQTESMTIKGLDYVVLTNVNGPLAVYRVRLDVSGEKVLKALKRWPVALSETFGWDHSKFSA